MKLKEWIEFNCSKANIMNCPLKIKVFKRKNLNNDNVALEISSNVNIINHYFGDCFLMSVTIEGIYLTLLVYDSALLSY